MQQDSDLKNISKSEKEMNQGVAIAQVQFTSKPDVARL